MYFCTDKSTKSSRQELLARTPLQRLNHYKRSSYFLPHSRNSPSVMIAPCLPTGRLRSRRFHCVLESPIILKVGVVWRFFEILRLIKSHTSLFQRHFIDCLQIFGPKIFQVCNLKVPATEVCDFHPLNLTA
jgi:hypothetical protein